MGMGIEAILKSERWIKKKARAYDCIFYERCLTKSAIKDNVKGWDNHIMPGNCNRQKCNRYESESDDEIPRISPSDMIGYLRICNAILNPDDIMKHSGKPCSKTLNGKPVK